MMLNLPEIIVVIIILVLVFGLGKLGAIGKGVARIRMHFQKELARDYVDITTQQPSRGGQKEGQKAAGPKPGSRSQPLEEAEIEPPSADTKTKESQ
ncbi:MAG: twin-arginine translocase TatA/TatE family subunit [Bradymonadaceae bacterium]